MALLIDGYNLLHASGIIARGLGPGTLERSREALLNCLAASLEPAVAARTIVVFDAGVSARGHVRESLHRGLRVLFSAGKADADDLIEDLIRADSAPRRLTVVSSDHRIQRAALRRRGVAIDSDKWFLGVLRSRAEAGRLPDPPFKPVGALAEHEVQYWLRRFGLEDSSAPSDDSKAAAEPGDSVDPRGPHSREKPTGTVNNPFPPGYAEDIFDEEQ